MTVEFMIWDHVSRPDGVPVADVFAHRVECVQRAEAAGFSRYHIAEHHGHSLSMAPSQFVYLSALARETTAIRLGTMVTCLPLHHPVRLAEEICMFDQLSGGRLDWAFGKGISPFEHTMFGHDPAESAARTDSMLAMILEGLQTGTMRGRGDYYDFPEVELSMEPVQRPYPLLWYPGNFVKAAEQNLNCIVPAPINAAQRATFDSLVAANSANTGRLNPTLERPLFGSTRFIVIAEDQREAETLGRQAAGSLGRLLAQSNGALPPHLQEPIADPTVAVRSLGDPDRAMKAGMFLWGTPDSVRDELVAYLRTGTTDLLSFGFFPGHLSLDASRRSLELFIDEVMPSLRALTPVGAAS